MTTTTGLEHPHWCAADKHSGDNLRHVQAPHRWVVDADDVELALGQNRLDELFGGTHLVGEATLLLFLTNVATGQTFDLDLSPTDALMLASLLTDYAHRAQGAR